MWISKKKLANLLAETERQAYLRGLDKDFEFKQEERLYKLEHQVKKLKKIIKEGY